MNNDIWCNIAIICVFLFIYVVVFCSLYENGGNNDLCTVCKRYLLLNVRKRVSFMCTEISAPSTRVLREGGAPKRSVRAACRLKVQIVLVVLVS